METGQRILRAILVPALSLLLTLLSCHTRSECRFPDASCDLFAGILVFSRQSASKAVYLTDNTNNQLYAYTIDRNTGLVTLAGQIATQVFPRGVLAHPAGFVYVANETTGSISIYRIDANNAPTLVTHFSVGGTPSALAMNSSGTLLYATRMGASVVSSYNIDSSTGLLTSTGFTGATDANTNQIALHPTLPYAFTGGQATANAYAFHLGTNGSFTPLTGVNTGTDTFFPLLPVGGRFLFIANNGVSRIELYSVSSQNGALSSLSPAFFNVGAQPGIILADSTGASLYVCIPISNSLRVFTMNAATGQPLTQIQSFNVAGGPYGLAMDPTNTFLYTASGASMHVYRRDASGAITQIQLPTPGGAAFNKVAILTTTAF